MNSINFNITNWFALCPGVAEINGWNILSKNQPLCVGVLNDSPVTLIPPMMRRRMSSLSKLAVQAAMQLALNNKVDYIIFASCHGELTRTVKLIEDIIDGNDASPILFSQSVHNTAAGLFTIATGQAISACSLASGEDTLHSAIIEASCYLHEHPRNKVLLVNFDEALPAPYQSFELQEYQKFALGFILESGKEFQIQAKQSSKVNKNSYPQAFACIDFLLKNSKITTINSKRNSWVWERKV